MQVFIVGSPLETAKAMARDTRRYNKQIIEVRQILDALNGAKAWSNHPCTLQYRGHELWLFDYMKCLEEYRKGEMFFARAFSNICDSIKPPFHTQGYFDQMKRRLVTKNEILYSQWAHLGTSDINHYFVDNE